MAALAPRPENPPERQTYPSSASNGCTNGRSAGGGSGIGLCGWALSSGCIVIVLECPARGALRRLRVGAGFVVVLLHKHLGSFVRCVLVKVEKWIVRVKGKGY
jgi:hypothetical protein